MPAPKKKKSFADLSNEDIALIGIEFANKKCAIKELESQCKECRKPLETYLDTEGRTLESGSKLAVISHADIDVHLKKTLRVSKVLLPEALDVIREKGLEDDCVEMVPTVREDVLERLYQEGRLTDEDLSRIYQPKSSYAFSVELKNKMPDAPEV